MRRLRKSGKDKIKIVTKQWNLKKIGENVEGFQTNPERRPIMRKKENFFQNPLKSKETPT